jgi:hypothetical protein
MMVPTEDNPQSLYHLIYSSAAARRLSQRELLELLQDARARNEARGLTGMLLYRDGIYLQFLEGRRPDIDELLGRLRKDPRHGDIRILQEGPLSGRMFPDWSMAYKNLAGLRSQNLPGYSEALQGQVPVVRRGNGVGARADSPPDAERLLVEMFQELLVGA